MPYTGLGIGRDITGELFLADIAIPKIVYLKLGRVGAGAGASGAGGAGGAA